MQTPLTSEQLNIVIAGFAICILAGYWLRGKVDEVRAINRSIAFDKKIKWGLEHPCGLVPTPKIKIASKMLKRVVCLKKIEASDEYGREV